MQIKKAFRKKTFYKNALLTFYFTAHGLGARGTPTRARALRLSGAPARAQRTPAPWARQKRERKNHRASDRDTLSTDTTQRRRGKRVNASRCNTTNEEHYVL